MKKTAIFIAAVSMIVMVTACERYEKGVEGIKQSKELKKELDEKTKDIKEKIKDMEKKKDTNKKPVDEK